MKKRHFLNFLILILPIFSFSQINHWESIIIEGDEWKFLIPNQQPAKDWVNQSYDDSKWNIGNSGFGYGDSDDKTILADSITSVYLRKKFEIKDLSKITSVILNMDYDDGFVAYLNGFEIARERILGNPPLYNQKTSGQHEALLYQGMIPTIYKINPNQLLEGVNILAIEVHNESKTSPDLSAIPILSVGIKDTSFDYKSTPLWFPKFLTNFQSNLPIIKLTTIDRAINNDTKVPVLMQIIDNGQGNINYSNQNIYAYEGNILTEWQGFTAVTYPKKNYDFDLIDNFGNKIDNVLLGMPAENDWILKAEYADPSLLKNSIAYEFARRMGNYAPQTKSCEIILDGVYIGYYNLTEVVKRSKQRVNIAKLKNDDISGNNLTGGYIIEMNLNEDDGDWNSIYPPINNSTSRFPVQFKYVYPNSDEILQVQGSYIHAYVDSFEYALNGEKYLDPKKGYRSFIDVATFIDYLLVNEFTVNYDSYARSVYMYKDKITNGGKLKIGPPWDYDEAFHYNEPKLTEGWVWQITHSYWPYPFWWSKMWTDPNYKKELAIRWKSLRENMLSTNSFMSYIDSISNNFAQAAERNFTIWDNVLFGLPYSSQIDSLKSFLQRRLKWMDNELLPLINLTNNRIDNHFSNDYVKIYPNPTDGQFQINSNIDLIGTSYDIYDQLGILLVTGKLNTVTTSIDIKNLSPNVYFLRINSKTKQAYKIIKK